LSSGVKGRTRGYLAFIGVVAREEGAMTNGDSSGEDNCDGELSVSSRAPLGIELFSVSSSKHQNEFRKLIETIEKKN
jgi:hypothetical protein